MGEDELIAPHLKPLEGPPPADIVVGSDTSMMNGLMLEYEYSTGRQYRLTFTSELVTFKMLAAPAYKPEFGVPVSLPYFARFVRDQLVMVHWMVPGRSGHVTLMIDFDMNKIFVSALMPFKMEFFDSADISLVEGWKG